MSVTGGLNLGLRYVTTEKADAAAIALASRLAGLIDAQTDPKIVGDLSAKLLAVLTALGMTPAARNGVMKGGDAGNGSPQSGIDTLTELRNRSKDRSGLSLAPNIHPPA